MIIILFVVIWYLIFKILKIPSSSTPVIITLSPTPTTSVTPTVKPPSNDIYTKGCLNWSWSGLNSGDKQTHSKTKYNGENVIMLDSAVPDTDIKKAKDLVGQQGLLIGYLSTGSIEDWRFNSLKEKGYKGPGPDLSATSAADMGEWTGEIWIDPNKWEKAMPYMKAQMEFMKSRGFNAIEVDNMSIDNNCSTKTCRDKNLEYALTIAKTAKDMNLKIFMKNGSSFGDVDKAYMVKLANAFDGLITEQSNTYTNDNSMYKSFVDIGKPWYNYEYRNKEKTCKTISGQTRTYFQTDNGWESCP